MYISERRDWAGGRAAGGGGGVPHGAGAGAAAAALGGRARPHAGAPPGTLPSCPSAFKLDETVIPSKELENESSLCVLQNKYLIIYIFTLI